MNYRDPCPVCPSTDMITFQDIHDILEAVEILIPFTS